MADMYSFITFLHKVVRFLGNRLAPKTLVSARLFSNAMLKKYGGAFSGNIVNVSGWDDRDREGGYYQEYFPNKKKYTISNMEGKQKGYGSSVSVGVEEIELDLSVPLPTSLRGAFNVVYNHTTLEHIFDIEQAFANLCEMSSDAVVLVVPSLQQIHIAETYGDYWRMTPMGVAKRFLRHGFTPLVITTNEQPFAPVYTFAIAVRDPKKYEGKIEKNLSYEMGGVLYGSKIEERFVEKLLVDE